MFCSTIIATIGRPTLARAVESVLEQAFTAGDFEVVVVNDSGQPLVPQDWHSSDRVRIVETSRRERSIARNTGAAVATGRYLHFLDDDDWLAPGALHTLWSVAQPSTATWIYGGSQLVDRRGHPILELRHGVSGNCLVQAIAGEWIPLQASIIDASAFFAAGGFNPLISGPEDIDLLRRLCLQGTLAGTPNVVARISWGAESSTTDHERHPAQSRWARERILNQPGVLARMRASAGSSYWQGRILRAYLTSLAWNVRRRRLLVAASRAACGLAGLALAGRRALSPAFWRAATRPHASEAFAEGLREANRTA
jgi:glycosyltransferase involved in cell wall biosynthesis